MVLRLTLKSIEIPVKKISTGIINAAKPNPRKIKKSLSWVPIFPSKFLIFTVLSANWLSVLWSSCQEKKNEKNAMIKNSANTIKNKPATV